jgi:phosphoglycerate-specific signal transduction histidine kinase
MGIALQNSRLFGQLSKRSAELQEINTKLEDELAERRKIQEELEKAMELAKAAAISKNQFLANMSHEVHSLFILCYLFIYYLLLFIRVPLFRFERL